MDRLVWIPLVCLFGACGSPAPKAQGEVCYGTSECAPGLVCNTLVEPAVCAPGADMLPVDAAPAQIDAAPLPDADPNIPDAAALPDAAVVVPDAAVLPDAAVVVPDAAI